MGCERCMHAFYSRRRGRESEMLNCGGLTLVSTTCDPTKIPLAERPCRSQRLPWMAAKHATKCRGVEEDLTNDSKSIQQSSHRSQRLSLGALDDHMTEPQRFQIALASDNASESVSLTLGPNSHCASVKRVDIFGHQSRTHGGQSWGRECGGQEVPTTLADCFSTAQL